MFTTPDGPEALQAAVEATLRRSEEHHRNSALPMLGLPTTWTGERQTGASSVWPGIGKLPHSKPAKTVPLHVRIDGALVVLRGVTFEGLSVARGEWQGLAADARRSSGPWTLDSP